MNESDDGFPRDAVAVVEGWSTVEATGPDAGKFLQAFCTNDVLKLDDGTSCEAMFTDVKARVLAYGWVGRGAEDRYTVLLGSDRAAELAAHLDRYLIREAVTLQARPAVEVSIGHLPGGVAVAALGDGLSAQWGADSSDSAARRLDPEDLERLRIGRRVPLDGVDVDERNLPQEVDRNDSAISFTKGCYLGQEPVARIDALGRVNWLLRTVSVEGPPPARDAELHSGDKPVGRVTSSVANGDGSLALAYVRREQSAPGTELRVNGVAASVINGAK